MVLQYQVPRLRMLPSLRPKFLLVALIHIVKEFCITLTNFPRSLIGLVYPLGSYHWLIGIYTIHK
jgi:hypothetical protein